MGISRELVSNVHSRPHPIPAESESAFYQNPQVIRMLTVFKKQRSRTVNINPGCAFELPGEVLNLAIQAPP